MAPKPKPKKGGEGKRPKSPSKNVKNRPNSSTGKQSPKKHVKKSAKKTAVARNGDTKGRGKGKSSKKTKKTKTKFDDFFTLTAAKAKKKLKEITKQRKEAEEKILVFAKRPKEKSQWEEKLIALKAKESTLNIVVSGHATGVVNILSSVLSNVIHHQLLQSHDPPLGKTWLRAREDYFKSCEGWWLCTSHQYPRGYWAMDDNGNYDSIAPTLTPAHVAVFTCDLDWMSSILQDTQDRISFQESRSYDTVLHAACLSLARLSSLERQAKTEEFADTVRAKVRRKSGLERQILSQVASSVLREAEHETTAHKLENNTQRNVTSMTGENDLADEWSVSDSNESKVSVEDQDSVESEGVDEEQVSQTGDIDDTKENNSDEEQGEVDECDQNLLSEFSKFYVSNTKLNESWWKVRCRDVLKQVLVYSTPSLVNCKNRFGETSLHLLAETNEVELFLELLKRGGDINVKDCDERTPLCVAIHVGNAQLVTQLIEHTTTHSTQQPEWDPNLIFVAVEGFDNGNMTFESFKCICELLITKCGLTLNFRDGKNRAPIHYACMGQHVTTLCWYLIERGCDPWPVDDYGMCPRDYLSRLDDSALSEMYTFAATAPK